LRRLPKHPRAELAVVTTPEGELHELGAQLSAVTIALQGYRVLYLGPSSPAQEIGRAARGASASIVALSIISLEPELAVRAVQSVLGELPETIEFVLGGSMAKRVRETLGPRVLVLGTLTDLDEWLEARKRRER
jgi:methanogenic corrinoid protein MtbC1